MQIVKLLFPKGLAEYPHRVLGRLPEPVLAVLAGILRKDCKGVEALAELGLSPGSARL